MGLPIVIAKDSMTFDKFSRGSIPTGIKQQTKNTRAESSDYWMQDAQDELSRKEGYKPLEKRAKNAIFFLGDGMSLPTVTAARIFKGQKVDGLPYGEEASLHMDTFPFTGTSKTFCADAQVADSACSATAYMCGAKGRIATIGVTPNVTLLNCAAQANTANHLPSILAWAQAAGKSTGIVTNTGVTHASPAGTYAHVALRAWENDAIVKISLGDPNKCEDIAKQLITREPGINFNVIMGGGRRNFIPITESDPEFPDTKGERWDGLNLIDQWISLKNATESNSRAKYITGRDELLSLDYTETDFLMGLFAPSHLPYFDGLAGNNYPTLEEMTEVAVKILSKNPEGFFLFVEGGRIDIAHHDNAIQKALVETLEFDKAIKKGDELTDDEDTLIVVTADHAHSMHFGGNAERGTPILKYGPELASDGLPYPTLGYANGARKNWFDPDTGKRHDIEKDNMEDLNYKPPVPISMIESESHGGEDVIIFAKGPWAHIFEGMNQQSFIPHAMAFAQCIGNGAKYCDDPRSNK